MHSLNEKVNQSETELNQQVLKQEYQIFKLDDAIRYI